MEEIKRFLLQTLDKVDGLHTILISDHDGILIVKATAEKYSEPNINFIHSFLPDINSAIEQSVKLDLGKNEKTICYYTNYQVVQLNGPTFLVTFVAEEKANTGNIMELEKALEPLLKDLKSILFS